MLKELVDKGVELVRNDELLPVGYGVYTDRINYIIHIYPDADSVKIAVEEYFGENRARAKLSTRAGTTIFPYPFADEMGYVFGIANKDDGTKDKNAAKKHLAYVGLFDEMLSSEYFRDALLTEAITMVRKVIIDGIALKALSGKCAFNKTWLTFVYEKGALKGKLLHELPATKEYWADRVKQKVCTGLLEECSTCGRTDNIVKNLPLKTTFNGSDRQIVSLNKNAFVSFRYQAKEAPLGICLSCADRASQALTLVSRNSSSIYVDKLANGKIKKDSLRNQFAVYWLKEESNIYIAEAEYNLTELTLVPLNFSSSITIDTTEELICKFLKSPWTGQKHTLNLEENDFCMAILSPNGPGRIAVRDWLQVSALNVKKNLIRYFEALNLVDAFSRQKRPYVVQDLLTIIPDTDPNMGRAIIRSAYLGENPPFSLFQSAIRRLRVSGARDGSLIKQETKKQNVIEPIEVWQRLCTIIKFYLTFGKEDANSMERLNNNRDNAAYQSGRLLAVLEQIQRRAATGKLSSTLVDRYYGSASTAPLTVFPGLISMATKAHMPKIRKNNRGYGELENLLEEIIAKIDEAGGLSRTLFPSQQGEFALGFYHQRADFNKNITK